MTTKTLGTPAAELSGTVQQAVDDLVAIASWLPGLTVQDAGRAAKILTRLSVEMAEAAAMVHAIPDRPSAQPGHTHAAVAALVTALEGEADFAD